MTYREKSKRKVKRALTLSCCAVIAAAIVFSAAGCGALKPTSPPPERAEPAAVTSPAPKATPLPTETPEETEMPSLAEALIRPEVKEALDSYEACMDEYIAFMQRFKAADAGDMAAMMGDYADMMTRYAEFAEKIDALGKEELNDAELAYYIEVTSRVSRKLLGAVG